MATFYALSTLASWSQVGGWSNTSGGASNGIAAPGTTDNVIFDANSGPARTITLNVGAQFASLTSTGSKMALDGGSNNGVYLNGPSLDISNFSYVTAAALYFYGASYGYNTTSFKTGSCVVTTTVNNVIVVASGGNGTLNLTGDINLNCTLGLANGGMNANGYNVTVASVNDSNVDNTYASGTCNFGTGTWTFTGASTCFSFSYLTQTYGVGVTFKFASSGVIQCNPSGFPASATLWATSGTVYFITSFSVSKVRVDAWATMGVTGGVASSATTWQVVGSTSFPANLTKYNGASNAVISSGAGTTTYLDFCKLTNISAGTGTFVARSSVDGGGNLGITFFKLKPHFLSNF